MNKNYYRDGKYYRGRAEECRVVGEILATPALRSKMLKIAADYERLADAADTAMSGAAYAADLPPLR
jgi:hypothetical protein